MIDLALAALLAAAAVQTPAESGQTVGTNGHTGTPGPDSISTVPEDEATQREYEVEEEEERVCRRVTEYDDFGRRRTRRSCRPR